ncbi:MAG: hypothetical protein ACREQP_06855 [Candidatus Binatia bacterium]
MKRLLSAGLVTAMLLAGSSTALAGKKATSLSCGTTYSVGPEDGSLLLQHHGKFSLLHVGYSAVIRDGKGQHLTLEDIRPGDWIEYWTDPVARTMVRKISVNSGGHANCSAPTVLGKR